MSHDQKKTRLLGFALLVLAATGSPQADEFTDADLQRWQKQFMSVVNKGRALWTDSGLGNNGVACVQCHPNAANTHPETYPKFQQQLGKVVPVWEMINWCIRNPLEGQPLAADDPKMTALQAYMTHERRGVKLEPGKH
ncbi:c-type cytochrome [Methylobacter sp.]|uniref:c-type cytochrome n=1 Tax=Methylobacter sp. TaxID=2051955 RepID=UPI003DA5D634